MSTLLAPPSTPVAAISAAAPALRMWTRAEYYQLADLGFFRGQRAERIGGAIMVMSPQNAAHFSTTERVAAVLCDRCGAAVCVRMQGPLELGQSSDPEPDVAVVPSRRDDYTSSHPTSALLVVEVSESSLSYDRGEKASLYAASGIADYWIVNLVNHQVEVLRNPQPDATQKFGWRFGPTVVLKAGANIQPLALPGVTIAVAELVG